MRGDHSLEGRPLVLYEFIKRTLDRRGVFPTTEEMAAALGVTPHKARYSLNKLMKSGIMLKRGSAFLFPMDEVHLLLNVHKGLIGVFTSLDAIQECLGDRFQYYPSTKTFINSQTGVAYVHAIAPINQTRDGVPGV